MRRLLSSRLGAIAILAVVSAGCAPGIRVLPVRVDPDALAWPTEIGPLGSYESAVRALSTLIVSDLGLPLPRTFTVFVYPSRMAYAKGLADVGRMSARRGAEIAEYSAGLGQHRRLFINDDAFRDTPRRAWLGVLAHELTHLAQYELSGGRRGRSEQWLREGMADWVACRALERLGETTFVSEKDRAKRAVLQALPGLARQRLDLIRLGRPLGREARHVRSGTGLTYRLAFLLAGDLIRQHGLESLIGYFHAFARSDDRFGHFQRAFGVSLRHFESDALRRLREVRPEPPSVTAPAGLTRREHQAK